MGTVASLSGTQLSVVPGESTTVSVTIRNTGSVVDSFVVDVLGPAAPWSRVDPQQVALMPGASGVVTVSISPPRESRTAAGVAPFAVRVHSTEDPAGSVVEEGSLAVGRFDDLSAELLPRARRARGRHRAKYELAIDNRGNGAVSVALNVADRDAKLGFSLSDPGVVVAPGTARFTTMRSWGKRGFWTGPPVTHPFQVLLEPGDMPPVAVDGTLLQEPRVPKWLPRALAALVALAAVLAVLWATLVKPSIDDTATNAAKSAVATPLAAAQNQIASLARHVGASAPPPLVSSGAHGAPTAAPVGPYGNPIDISLAATAGNQSPSYAMGAHQYFSLTDLVLQNSSGDTGVLQIRRNSQVLVQASLADFRELDYHFVAPVEFTPSSSLTMQITCRNTGGTPPPCTPAVLLSGFSQSSPPGH